MLLRDVEEPVANAQAAPTLMWYYLDADQTRCGPVLPEELVHLYSLGELHDYTLVFSTQMEQWKAVHLVDTGMLGQQDTWTKRRRRATMPTAATAE